MNRRRRGSLAGSPLLIGAVTTLIIVVAVFLSYNANNGLPFVPTYNIKVELPETSGLQKANQVRIAGTRVGLISSLSPHMDPATGRITAIADLKLEKKVEPLPADTKVIVLSVSTIGLKYLELEKGTANKTIPAGGTIPVDQTREPVDINALFNMFSKPTRTAIQQNTIATGNGLAARGLGLNQTIAELRPLVTKAIPVLHNVASPQTNFRNLFPALDRVAEQNAAVSETNAAFFTDLDTFFTAWAGVAPSLEETIKEGPESLEAGTRSFAAQVPVADKTAEFMRLLRPSAVALQSVAPALGHAFEVGAVNLHAAVALNTETAEAAEAFEKFAQNPVVPLSLEELTHTAEIGTPLLAGIAQPQAFCNYLTLLFRNVSNLQAENVGVGTLARAAVVLSPTGPNAQGFPASAPANGPSVEHPFDSNAIIDNNHVHVNPYPNVAGPGQPKLCEAGNEGFTPGQAQFGNQPASLVTNNRELTTREQNLFGERYPTSTLEALGIKKGGKG